MDGHMKKMQGFLVIVVLLFSVAGHAKTASEIFEAVSPSIVVIRTYDANGKALSLGSGVVLASDLVATNCHVIQGATKIQAVRQGKEHLGTVRHSDWDRDICTLTVNGINAPSVVTGTTNRLKVGSRVYAIGAPKGLELTLSEGIISSLRPVAGGHYLQITAPISPGSSGGGLFDEEGRLIGLPSFYLAEGQQLNFAIPVEWITDLPRRHKDTVKALDTTTIVWLNKAMAFTKEKDWASLLTHSLRWTEACPEQAEAWYYLGVAYGSESGQIAREIDAYKHPLRIRPEDADTWNTLGIAYLRSGQTAKGIDALQQALRIRPEDADVWNILGMAYGQSGQTAKEIEAFQQTLHINPEYEHAWFNLGSAYRESGQNVKAIAAYQQALRINPESAEAWYNLGLTYAKSGQKTNVLEVYRRLKTLDPAKADDFFNKVVLP
jgi:Flp pilus assembly protein TadD